MPEGGAHLRVWARRRRKVEAVFEDGPACELSPEGDGYFSGVAESARDGALYRFRLDGEPALYPDPASRFQPYGPHGPSQIVDPNRFAWSDAAWRGARREGHVIYEMHIGTFTREGTYAAAMAQLPELASMGITLVELMPVAEFPGRFGWGYDGVDLFAPTRLYGRPDDLRRFVDRAHALGLSVILDVVYNHIGPEGNYLPQFSADYFSKKHKSDWGDAINFDGEHSGPVREFFVANAVYWIAEFRMDGLRLDATHAIHDDSPVHITAEIGVRAREAAGARSIFLVAENEPEHTRFVRPAEEGGYGFDALWNDDFHHSAIVALTGRKEAYYDDYFGRPQEMISVAKYGSLFQGQLFSWQGKRRGEPSSGLAPSVFVNYLQNHDQVANSARGERIHLLTDPGRLKAMTALLLLAPGTPMLFQGQEFAASAPFLYFADLNEDLARSVHEGRIDFLRQFRSLALEEMRPVFRKPGDTETFELSKLDFRERESHAAVYALHKDLLRLRHEDPAFRAQAPDLLDGAVLGHDAFALRYFMGGADDRLLLVNLGVDLQYARAPEPLLAPPGNMRWKKLWSTEEPQYHGCGYPKVETGESWIVLGHAAVVLKPEPPSERELHRERRIEKKTVAVRRREKEAGG